MRPTRRFTLAAGCAVLGALAVPAVSPAAEQLAGVTAGNRLVLFNSDSPGSVRYQVPIQGLGAGETIRGIDVRPATGGLYALGSTSRVYRLDVATGAATPVGDPFTPALDGTSFGFDFNPSVDRIRVTSDADQDLRLNPDTGATAATDAALQYAAGDPGAGTNPNVGASAYTPAAFGAATTLFDIDSGRDVLVTQNPPNSGTLNTVGALGVTVDEPAGFDIAGDGTAYAALKRSGQAAPELFTIDLSTGAATPVRSQPGLAQLANRGANDTVTGIAALGRTADDRKAPAVSVAFSSTQLESRLVSDGILATVNCDEACTIAATATVGGRDAGSVVAAGVTESAGLARIDLDLDDAAKALVRRPGNVTVRLTVVVTDAAGNAVTTRRNARSQTLEQRRGR
jgi:hypothetical protein